MLASCAKSKCCCSSGGINAIAIDCYINAIAKAKLTGTLGHTLGLNIYCCYKN